MKSSPFANLFSFSAKKKAAKEEEEECKQHEGESDEEYAKRMRKMEFEDGDERRQAEDESDEDYSARMKKRTKAESEKEEEEEEEEEREKEKAAAFANGFKAGGARWQTVLSSDVAVGRGTMACELLASTEMTAPDILKTLAKMPTENSGAKSGLYARMAQSEAATPKPTPGAAPAAAPGDAKAVAAACLAAADKARGEKKAA